MASENPLHHTHCFRFILGKSRYLHLRSYLYPLPLLSTFFNDKSLLEYSKTISDLACTYKVDEFVSEDYVYGPRWRLLTELFELRDSARTTRVHAAMGPLLNDIQESCSRRGREPVEYLIRLVKKNEIVRQWLVDHLDIWLYQWLVELPAYHLVCKLFKYVLSLFFVDHYSNHTTTRLASAETKQLLYTHVFQSLQRAANNMIEEPHHDGSTPWSGSSRLSACRACFARLLRHFMPDLDIACSALLSRHQELLDLLIQLTESKCDENTHELFKLWSQLLEQFPEMAHRTAISESAQKLLLSFYFYFASKSCYLVNTNATLLPFCQVINMCCDHEAFLSLYAMHPASDWMLLHLFLKDDEYQSLETTLYEIIRKCTQSETHRHKIIEAVLGSNKSEQEEERASDSGISCFLSIYFVSLISPPFFCYIFIVFLFFLC